MLIHVNDEKKTFHQLCQNRYITICSALGFEIREKCDLAEIKEPIFDQTAGMMVWKGFPYKEIMIKTLKRIQFSGLEKLKKNNKIIPNEESRGFQPLSLFSVFPVFLLFISFIFLTVLIFLIEKLAHRLRDQ